MRATFLLGIISLLAGNISCFAQDLKPGFDAKEYQQMMYISARTGALKPDYYKDIPEPAEFKMVYRSKPMGLDNLWDLWSNNKTSAVISLRGTTDQPTSWLDNFYAAMVPAKGELKLGSNDVFRYELASHPGAAVHVGWLLGTAFLSKEIVPKIDSSYKAGVRNIIIMGHSQGGAIAFLLTSHLYNLQSKGQLPKDIRFKTYCSAGPKPGNLYYAYDYEHMTHEGWSYNVVNSADWVPETPISIQTSDDFNKTNPFVNAKKGIKQQPLGKRIVLNHLYNKLDKPTKKARRNYKKYMGNAVAKIIQKNLKDFEPPAYANTNNYVRTGITILLMADESYYKLYPDQEKNVFVHHLHQPYLYLLDKYK